MFAHSAALMRTVHIYLYNIEKTHGIVPELKKNYIYL
jgi:hypothetical protein